MRLNLNGILWLFNWIFINKIIIFLALKKTIVRLYFWLPSLLLSHGQHTACCVQMFSHAKIIAQYIVILRGQIHRTKLINRLLMHTVLSNRSHNMYLPKRKSLCRFGMNIENPSHNHEMVPKKLYIYNSANIGRTMVAHIWTRVECAAINMQPIITQAQNVGTGVAIANACKLVYAKMLWRKCNRCH